MVYTANWVIIYYLPPFTGTWKIHWVFVWFTTCTHHVRSLRSWIAGPFPQAVKLPSLEAKNLGFCHPNWPFPNAQWGWSIHLQNWVVLGVNVGKYTLHWASGNGIWATLPLKKSYPLKINGWFRCISYWVTAPFWGDMLVFRGVSSWWFHPSEKYDGQIGSSPQFRAKIKNIWNHHMGASAIVVVLQKDIIKFGRPLSVTSVWYQSK